MKSFKIWVSLLVVLTFVILAGCGGGSSDGVGVPTKSQVKISTVKEISETGISSNEEYKAKSSSAEITIPANSINSSYDLSINKINTTNLDSADLSYLKSYFGFDENVEFFSPIINCDISTNNKVSNVFRASLNVNSDGFLLKNVGNVLLKNDKAITDWVNKHYYFAFSNEKNAKWSYTPLNKEHFNNNYNQLSFNINKIYKYYVIIAIVTDINIGVVPEVSDLTNTETQTSTGTSTDTNLVTNISIIAKPNSLIASDSGKFNEDMDLFVTIEYSGDNPFINTTPSIEFLSFSPFELGKSVKSN